MICLFTIFISLPLYGVLSLFFGKYTNGYVWRISASFLSGKKPAIAVFVMFLCFLCFLKYLLLNQRDAVDSKNNYKVNAS